MDFEMTFFRAFLGVLAVAFAGLIWWAITKGDFGAEGTWLISNPWGIVSLADLYIGFLLSAVVIAGFEKRSHAFFWILPIPFLGNVWTLIWFVLRLPMLWRRLRVA